MGQLLKVSKAQSLNVDNDTHLGGGPWRWRDFKAPSTLAGQLLLLGPGWAGSTGQSGHCPAHVPSCQAPHHLCVCVCEAADVPKGRSATVLLCSSLLSLIVEEEAETLNLGGGVIWKQSAHPLREKSYLRLDRVFLWGFFWTQIRVVWRLSSWLPLSSFGRGSGRGISAPKVWSSEPEGHFHNRQRGGGLSGSSRGALASQPAGPTWDPEH